MRSRVDVMADASKAKFSSSSHATLKNTATGNSSSTKKESDNEA